MHNGTSCDDYTCGSVLRKYAFKKVRPLDGILRVKKVRVLARSIYFLNLTQPRLAPKLDAAHAGRGRLKAVALRPGEETPAETDGRPTLSRKRCLQIFKKVIVDP